jgi:hypothetical protein
VPIRLALKSLCACVSSVVHVISYKGPKRTRQEVTELHPCTLAPYLAKAMSEPLGLKSHIANPADQVTAGVLVCLDGHDFDRIRLVMWTQDQVVPG